MTTETETAPAPSAPAGRVGWRRGILVLLVIAGVLMVARHVLGAGTSMLVAVGSGALLLVVAVVWLGPKLWKHVHPFGKSQKAQRTQRTRTSTRTSGSPRRHGAAFRSPGTGSKRRGLGLGHKGSGTGHGRRRTGGLNYPSQRGKGLLQGIGKGRRKSGSGAGTGPSGRKRRSSGTLLGTSRRKGGSGRSSKGSGAASGARSRRAGPFRGSRRDSPGSGGSRRHSPAFRRITGRRRTSTGGRTGTGTGTPRPRRRLTRPSTWLGKSRRRTVTPPGTSTGTPPRSRRRLTRPSSWFRRRTRTSTGGQPGTGSPRSRRNAMTGYFARAWFPRLRSRTGTGTPGRVRRGWHRMAGTPQQRRNRRIARIAHRARLRARRRQSAANLNPYARRSHGWMFWRRQSRLGARTHAATGLPLTRRQRIARWWRLRRGQHAGLGISGILTRARRPPRPLLGGTVRGNPAMARFRRSALGRLIARVDRRRRDRWIDRQRRAAPVPVPRTAPAIAGTAAGSPNGTRKPAGGYVDTNAMADQIREMGGAEFADPQDVHDSVAGMHEVLRALQDTMNGWGLSISETGLLQVYAETVHEVSGDMGSAADKLESVLSGGVMRGPGG